MSWASEIWARYLELLPAHALQMALLFVVGAAGVFGLATLERKHRELSGLGRLLGRVTLAIALVVGAYFAISKASLFDDAYISFRYSKNFAEGHGLVFNVGEPVEGYTNFLWTVLIGLLVMVTPFDAPEIGVVLALAAFLANLVVISRVSALLRDDRGATLFVPLSLLLLAVQDTFTCYGTSGLETGFASLLVNCGVYFLLSTRRPGTTALAGLFFILATLTRPDHALFYAVGSLVVVVSFGPYVLSALRRGLGAMWDDGVDHFVAYAAPFVLYLAYLGWKLSFYGELLPNTYYAKSANLTYYGQGALYAEAFYLASHFWLVVPVFLVGLFLPAKNDAARRFRWFALISTAAYNVYVLKVGGDFMFGRFYVTLIPLFVLGAERAVAFAVEKASVRAHVVGAAAAGLLVATAGGLTFFKPYEIKWHICDERTFYPLTHWFPAEVDHANYRLGKQLGELHAAGLDPLVATSGVGMLGYYSMVPILDRVGLVDKTVAHIEIEKRGRPGHEKWAPDWYIKERKPNFIRGGDHLPKRYLKLTKISFGKDRGRRRWDIFRYDRALMHRLKEVLPDARFVDFEKHLDDYLEGAADKPSAEIEEDLAFFRTYYFDGNDDEVRLKRMIVALEAAREREAAPPELPTDVPGPEPIP